MHKNNTYLAKTTGGIETIPYDQIIYFEVTHNDMYIHLENNREIRERKSMQKLSVELISMDFIQIGKSFLVNMQHIQKINNRKVFLSNNQIIDIPKTQYSSIYKAFLMFSSR